jgi:hypothetical protein
MEAYTKYHETTIQQNSTAWTETPVADDATAHKLELAINNLAFAAERFHSESVESRRTARAHKSTTGIQQLHWHWKPCTKAKRCSTMQT